MSAREKIIDYSEHSEEIEKWIALKGEIKYLRFAELLNKNGVPVKWETLKDTYRYDKRLLVNVFKYLSFFEEFLRAQIWNIDKESYEKIEKYGLLEVINEIISIKDKINYEGFSMTALEQSKEKINYLRNCVAHNKIILETEKDNAHIKDILNAFKNCLPESYQQNFSKAIKKCAYGLNIPDKLKISI
ncbi:MAG: hypothetical protein K2I95_10260 [Treponemataceae bacterium]|nr:hypothetical protein [Treponemataceae bacterium]